MKTSRRIYKEEAELLGLTPKPNEPNRKNARYSITNEQYNRILDFRSEAKSFDVSAWSKDGRIMGIDEYCDVYGLNRGNIKNWRLCTHTKVPTYNISFKEDKEKNINLFDPFEALEEELKNIPTYNKIKPKGKRVGVATITDIHFGAYIEGLNITPEYNITILCNKLEKAAFKINRFKYDVVELHLLGDLIESFTGLNHKNSWKGLAKGMFGVKAIKLFVKLFKKHFLDKIINLNSIKIVAGNHDRVTSDKNEDADGGAAELIAWGLSNLGYDVEFNRSIITHEIGNVNHILGHGHLFMMMKKTTQELCWMYGKKGCFNYIKEGHLHTRMRKLNAKQISNFKMVSDDTIDCRREVIASIFTGNQHSEDGGWSTLAGFSISEENEDSNGVDVYDLSL